MITNAIPGITNLGSLVNTAPAKGIAASKEQTADFYKALNNANTQRQTATVNSSVAKTLSNTLNTNDNNKVAATYEKSQDVRRTNNFAENKNTGATTERAETQEVVTDEKNVQGNNTDRVARDQNAAVSEEVTEQTEEITEEAVETTEGTLIPDFILQINENPEGEGNAIAVIDDALTELEQAMLDSSRELMQQLADSLGVDIEDIENAMATLGLTNVAILDPTNLTQIMGQVTGANDVMAIVTNADLYLNVQNMQDAVETTRQDLMQEFNLSEEGLSSALEDFSENLEQKNAESQIQIEISEPVAKAENPVIVETPNTTISNEGVRLDISEDEGIVKEVTIQDQAATTSEVAAEVTSEVKTTENPDTLQTENEKPDFQLQVEAPVQEQRSRESENNNGGNSNNRGTGEHTDGSIYNQVMNQISSSLSEVVETENYEQMTRANTQEIMEQITESIKMNVKADTTTMEMQLHPASLGNVNVIIEAAKDGNVIAKFLTQNEDVRAAIESQLQQLQEKLNEQGVKVTAVEVTVNAEAFNQTLNDSQSQREDDRDAQESIRKPMRRIRLDELTMDNLEEIEEEDKLTAEMMAINGNSVDFSA